MGGDQERVGADGIAHAAPRDAEATRTAPLTTFLVLLVLIALFRLLALMANGTDLFMDEAQYWAWSRDLDVGYFSKPPLIAWIIRGATTLCGDGEVCIRLPSLVLHTATAILVYALAARLYSQQVALWSGLGYALLPAVSLSSGIISTDVPLLAAWALGLWAFAGLMAAPTLRDTILLALALGVGLNAKYAMAYFVLCAAVYFVMVPAHRARFRQPHVWLAFAGGLVLIAPNLIWNVANGFITFAHTADNANWRGVPFHPGKAAEFLLAQFGVFGPVLFGALLAIAWQALRRRGTLIAADKLLLAFSIPILVLVTTQGLISRAHANWAAPTYVASIVLVTAVLVRHGAWRWLRASSALHVALAVLLAVATWQAGRFTLIGIGDPFARTLGNRALASAVREEIAAAAKDGRPIGSVLTDNRELAAALAYYLRDDAIPVLSWREGNVPRSYFEMKQPFTAAASGPFLLVSPRSSSPAMTHFSTIAAPRARAIPTGAHATRTVHFSLLTDFQQR